MKLQSVRIITADLERLVASYELVTDRRAVWATPAFAEIDTDGGTVALGDVSTLAAFAPDSPLPTVNTSTIVEFLVDDVDSAWDRLRDRVGDVVAAPTTLPWGNRSLLLRDPDGGLVNLFTPVTPAARAKFGLTSEAR